MDKIFATIIEHFENFIRRSLMPSSTFLLFYIIFDFFYMNSQFLKLLNKSLSPLLLSSLIIAFIGLGTILTILHQALYDNRLKWNFDGSKFFTKENNDLKYFRDKVINKLKIEETTDYLLYQILGQKTKNTKKDVNTTRYVDNIKTIGISFLSFLLVLFIAVSHNLTTDNSLFWKITIFIFFIISIYPIYYIGQELIKSKYRSRAIRIYINYLETKEEELVKKETLTNN